MLFPAFWLVKNSAINPQLASFLSANKELLINRIFLDPQLHLLLNLANKPNQTTCIQFTN